MLININAATRETTYAYDLSGNIHAQALPNGEVITNAYDELNRLIGRLTTRADSSVLASQAFSYDAVGNLIAFSVTSSDLAPQNVVLEYDPANRLTRESLSYTVGSAETEHVTEYEYDAAYNRTSKSVTIDPGQLSPVTTNYYYNSVNELTNYGPGTNGASANTTFDYDGNGNRTATNPPGAPSVMYEYDQENRLISVDEGEEPPEYAYAYDYRTRRVQRIENAESTKVTYVGGLSAYEFETSTGHIDVEVRYVRGSDLGGGIGGLLYSLRGDPQDLESSFNHYNARGDVIAKTDVDAAITWEGIYEAFGTQVWEGGSNEDRQRANTKEEDPTGLLNEGFRVRDLDTAVFLTRDPAGFVDGPNLYTYVRQNPWTKFDPLGLQTGRKYTPAQLAAKRAQRERQAQAFKEYGGWKQVGSTGADFVPFVGTGKGAYETFTGKDPVTGKSLSGGERVVAGIGTVASLIPGGKLVVKGIGKGVMKGADDVADVASVANKIDNAADVGGDSARVTQKVSEEAAEAATPQVGDKVTRHWGGESGPDGQSWTRDPASAQTRENLGLGRSNTGEFVSDGTLVDTTGVTSRKAKEWDEFSGGGDEVVIPDPQNQVRLDSVRMPDEPLPDK